MEHIYTNKDANMDESLLEHYDDLMDTRGYERVIDRMRRNGHEPRGPAAPRPGSSFYRGSK